METPPSLNPTSDSHLYVTHDDPMKNQVEERFSDFFEKWFGQLEDYVGQLSMVSKERGSDEAEMEILVSKVKTHYKEFYQVKWAQAHEDVLAFFSPVWLTPLENAYSWVTGWKPSMAFRLVQKLSGLAVSFKSLSGLGFCEEQERKIEELRLKIKLEEEKVERELERQQVAMADPKMVKLARVVSRKRDVEEVEGLVEVALKNLMAGLEKVMKAADCVRLKTLKCVLEELNPLQRVDFLAAVSMLQIQLRRWGKRRSNDQWGHDLGF